MRSILVAVVATVAIIGPAQAQDSAAKRVAPEIGTAGYSIATEEQRHAAYPRRRWHERHHAAYPRRRWHARPPISHSQANPR
jgi:hypothetical protein